MGVNRPADPAITVTFDDVLVGAKIRSDGRGAYEDAVCNVDATFNLNDARMSLKGRIKKKDQAACGDPRFIAVDFTDRVTNSPPGGQDGNTAQFRFMNIDQVETVTNVESRKGAFGFVGCAQGLVFDPELSQEGFPVNAVEVTKIGERTWTVEALSPNDVAVCIPSELDPNPRARSYYHMPFRLIVTLK